VGGKTASDKQACPEWEWNWQRGQDSKIGEASKAVVAWKHTNTPHRHTLTQTPPPPTQTHKTVLQRRAFFPRSGDGSELKELDVVWI